MENKYRPGLEIPPARMQRLPVDKRGYPVPWFVAWIDGEPEFRAMDHEKLVKAVNEKRCWVCGDILGRNFTFVIGPMCGVNRVSSEPPSHRECAEYSARMCPFMSMPKMVRREGGLPEKLGFAGIAIMRNPGVSLLWHTREYKVQKVKGDPAIGSGDGILFRIGEPFEIKFYAEGRLATRAEVDESIRTGMPLLEDGCEKEETPELRALARKHLVGQVERFLPLLPAV